MRKAALFLATLLFLLPHICFSQTRQITGTVTDENGIPLPSVSVVARGTNSGTTTNETGSFTLTVSGVNPILVFSYAGREAQEVRVGSSDTYNVSLRTIGTICN